MTAIDSRRRFCVRHLAAWKDFAERDWYAIPGHPDLGVYGTGYNAWGVQTNQKYAAAMAVLATQPAGVVGDAVRASALRRALAALRYSLHSHLANGGTCTDGTPWGNTWIAALGIERLMHALPRLAPHFDDADRDGLRRVLVSEADWLLHHYTRGGHRGVTGALWAASGRNDPESNIWNGAILWRTAVLYPDHPHAADWTEQAHTFLVNGISIPTDAEAHDAVLAGKSIAERHRGPNFFPNYALDHHGYLNVGYMAICLSNIAMLHFDHRAAGLPVPETLYLHAADLWRLVRRLVFADGRLARIGGDTRLRYAYCQDYLLPTLALAADRFGDPYAIELLDRTFDWIALEAAYNGDGSFFGRRFAALRGASPYYYTRLESDRAGVLGMTCAYLAVIGRADDTIRPRDAAAHAAFEASVAGGWCEPEHGAVLHRCATRLASYAWRGFGLGIGLCLPPSNGHLAEWQTNLTGRIRFVGDSGPCAGPPARAVEHQSIHPFAGGFATLGTLLEGSSLSVPEGWKRNAHSARHHVAFAALPDGHTVVGLQHCRAEAYRVYVQALEGLAWRVPNDLFNGGRRTLETAAGRQELRSPPAKDADIPLGSSWACVDGQAGVAGIYGAEELTLVRRTARQGAYPSLHIESLCFGHLAEVRAFPPASTLLDCGWLAFSGLDAAAVAAAAGAARRFAGTADDETRAVEVRGQDRRTYWVAANFGTRNSLLTLPRAARDCVTGCAFPAGANPLPARTLVVLAAT